MHIQNTSASNPMLPIKHAQVERLASSPSGAVLGGVGAGSAASDSTLAVRAADVNAITRGMAAPPAVAECTAGETVAGNKYNLNVGTTQTGDAANSLTPDDVPPTNPAPPAPPAATMETLLDIVGAWDTSNPEFDFTNDGVVNIQDLLHVIRNGISVSVPGPVVEQPPKPTDLSNTTITAPTIADAINDVLADAPGKMPSVEAPSVPAEHSKACSESDRIRQIDVRGQKLVDSLIDRLNQNGFEDQPPTNIRELVDQLNLRPAQMNFVMHRLGEHYPIGLGVNLKA